jgi:DNA anti-recombination protein RmuC
MSQTSDTALIAGQLADLTESVREMAEQLSSIRERADTQQERIVLAARELTEVCARLLAAADALREAL